MRYVSIPVWVVFAALAQAQQPNVAAQREAMKKLEFLVGKWSGDASVSRGGGPPMHLLQTEDVQMKMDGLVMEVDGAGRNGSGEIVFRALATISYDDATSTYHFRAYNDGRYLDTQLKVTPDGFEWGFPAGPAQISNVMKVNDKGEWVETTQMTMNGSPPRTLVEMLLQRGSTSGGSFDGQWTTTVSCESARGGLGYSYRFVSNVKDGNLRGLYGQEGQPSSLLIEGKISPDGTGKLYATGRVGSKEYVPGRETPRGTAYNYNIDAHFNGDTGTGTRVEGRPCSFQFEKQRPGP